MGSVLSILFNLIHWVFKVIAGSSISICILEKRCLKLTCYRPNPIHMTGQFPGSLASFSHIPLRLSIQNSNHIGHQHSELLAVGSSISIHSTKANPASISNAYWMKAPLMVNRFATTDLRHCLCLFPLQTNSYHA